jgi:hypothetical protein
VIGIDLFDVPIFDAGEVAGAASLESLQLVAGSAIGGRSSCQQADIDFRVWWTWNETSDQIYLSAE